MLCLIGSMWLLPGRRGEVTVQVTDLQTPKSSLPMLRVSTRRAREDPEAEELLTKLVLTA